MVLAAARIHPPERQAVHEQLRAGIETGRFTPRCEIGIVKRQRLGNRRAGSCGIHDIPTGVGHLEPSRV